MTENKRFVITKSNFIEDGWFIDDTVGNFSFGTTKDKSSLVMYEKQLNELHDKNKQLRKENYEFLDEIASLNEVQIPNISKKISDLEYENEQLKRQIGNLEHTRDFCADVCADYERLEKEHTQLSINYNGLGLEYEGLEEENKQLKQDKRRLVNYISKTSNLSDKAIQQLIIEDEFNDVK